MKRNGQFTVNIALVQGSSPVLGVVYVPVQRKMYWGVKGKGSFCKVIGDTEVRQLSCAHFSEKDEGLTIVGSSSHSTPLVDAFVSKYATPKFTAIGSSLKFMLVAEGEAAIYPRFAPSCEWDTCASQVCIDLRKPLPRTLQIHLHFSVVYERARIPYPLRALLCRS